MGLFYNFDNKDELLINYKIFDKRRREEIKTKLTIYFSLESLTNLNWKTKRHQKKKKQKKY